MTVDWDEEKIEMKEMINQEKKEINWSLEYLY